MEPEERAGRQQNDGAVVRFLWRLGNFGAGAASKGAPRPQKASLI